MPRACSVCGHPDREAINAALRAGASNRSAAQRFGVGTSAVDRHARRHLAPAPIADAGTAPDAGPSLDAGPPGTEVARPARGYTWPPFEPGNTAALRHGAWSPRTVEPVAAQLVEAIAQDPGVSYLAVPSYRPAVLAWAQAEARVVLLEAWVAGMTIEQAAESGQGRVSPLALLDRWEGRAANHRSRLGLDPLARARLGKDVAQGRQADAAAELTRMREEHERAQRAVRGEVVDGG